MPENKNRACKFKPAYLQATGIAFILILVVLLLWHGNATSMQAQPALLAGVYFDGEYRIADGAWQEIVEGEHIPATKGDVTPDTDPVRRGTEACGALCQYREGPFPRHDRPL